MTESKKILELPNLKISAFTLAGSHTELPRTDRVAHLS